MDFTRKSQIGNALFGFLLTVAIAFAAPPSRAGNISWNNASGGIWSNPTNWTPNQVPGATDTALITNATGTFTVTVDVNSAASSLTIGGGAAGVQTLLVSNGVTLSIGGTVNAAFNGPVMVAQGGLLNLASTLNLFSVVTNAGTLNLSNTFVSVFNFTNNASAQGGFVNQSGGLIDFRGDANILPAFGGGQGYLTNQGTLRKSAGAGTSAIRLNSFDNTSGSVDVESGSLTLQNFNSTLAGNFNAAAGTVVSLSGGTLAAPLVPGSPLVLGGPGQYLFPAGVLLLPADIIPGLVLQGGTLELGPAFQGGTITNLALAGISLTGTNVISGMMAVTNSTITGTFIVTNGGVLTASGAFLNGMNLSNGLTVLAGGLVHTVGNGLTINLNGSSNNLASMTVASGGAVQLNDFSAALSLYGPLTNAGTITFTNTDINVANDGTLARQGSIFNLAGGMISISGGGSISGSGGQASIFNQGTVQSSGSSAGIGGFNLFSNEGTLHSSGGSLTFLNVSNFTLQPSGTLSVDITGFDNSGRFVFSSGTGTLHLAGTFSADLTNGFVPGFNNMFNVVTYNSFSGSFANLILPPAVNWITNFGTNVFSLRTPAPPVQLTVTNVTANDRNYDGTTNATLDLISAALVGVANGDSVTLSTSNAVGFFTNKNEGFGLKVVVSGVTISGPDVSKYTLKQPTTTANIFQLPLTITGVTASNRVYDADYDVTINVDHAAISGVLTNENVLLDTNGAMGVLLDATAEIGDQVFVFGWSLAGPDADNYLLPFNPVNADNSLLTVDIAPKPLAVSGITANNKPYDGTTTATLNTNNASLPGVISPDDVSLGAGYLAAFASPNLGTNIPVTVSGLTLAGTNASNYILTQPTGLAANIFGGDGPMILFITASLGTNFLHGIGGAGHTYVIQSAPRLDTGPWSDLSGPLLADGAGLINYHDIAPPAPRFYRTRVGP